jgi:hypothetical protein
VLIALGLALGVVGAAVLALGLFRPSKPLYPGWSRDPLQAATDQAFGITGFLFLGVGFLLQALPLFGVHATECAEAAGIAAAAGLLGGGFVPWVAGEALRAWRFYREKEYTAKTYTPFMASLVLKPGIERPARLPLPRLWRLAYVNMDWPNCKVIAEEAANGGFTLEVPMSGFRENSWDRAFEVNAVDAKYRPPNPTWDTPTVREDKVVVHGLRADTDLRALRGLLNNVVYITNQQVEERRVAAKKHAPVPPVEVPEGREAEVQRMTDTLRRRR